MYAVERIVVEGDEVAAFGGGLDGVQHAGVFQGKRQCSKSCVWSYTTLTLRTARFGVWRVIL